LREKILKKGNGREGKRKGVSLQNFFQGNLSNFKASGQTSPGEGSGIEILRLRIDFPQQFGFEGFLLQKKTRGSYPGDLNLPGFFSLLDLRENPVSRENFPKGKENRGSRAGEKNYSPRFLTFIAPRPKSLCVGVINQFFFPFGRRENVCVRVPHSIQIWGCVPHGEVFLGAQWGPRGGYSRERGFFPAPGEESPNSGEQWGV